MPVISFRLDKKELAAIRQECQARGYVYVSELVREKLGLQPGEGRTAPSPLMEKIDSEVRDPVVAAILREHTDRLDQIIRMENAVAKQVGVPKDLAAFTAQKAPANHPFADPAVTAGFDR